MAANFTQKKQGASSSASQVAEACSAAQHSGNLTTCFQRTRSSAPVPLCYMLLFLVVMASTLTHGDGFLSAHHPQTGLTLGPLKRMVAPSPQRASARSAPLLASTKSPPFTQSTSSDGNPPRLLTNWAVANRSVLLLLCLVIHKCSTDGLTR